MKTLSAFALFFVLTFSAAFTQEVVPKAPKPTAVKDTTKTLLPKKDRIFSIFLSLGNSSKRGSGFGIGMKIKEYGLQVTNVGSSASTPECLDYLPPHNDYKELTYQKALVSVDLLYMPRVTKYFSVFVGLGYAYRPYDKVARSNATGWYYKLGSGTTENGVSFTGGAYFDYEWFGFGAGYHSNIGPHITLGVNL